MGLELMKMELDEVVVEWTIDDRHRQPFGIVHGGVHSGVIETVCSMGAALHAAPRGQTVVGVENHTSFVRAVGEGRLRATGKPLQIGKRAQLWEASIVSVADAGGGRLIATGRVRLFCQDPRPT
jgi:1,4-dihydroxy-2-naphthoyl-CoA hydrolase